MTLGIARLELTNLSQENWTVLNVTSLQAPIALSHFTEKMMDVTALPAEYHNLSLKENYLLVADNSFKGELLAAFLKRQGFNVKYLLGGSQRLKAAV
ncbi:hypothetical protein [Enterococcus nangangensis]|uniref:hypothetical protein n=1 Tax=Enterococcus nangangensis TaxID=2559926 RepID=UPI0010F9D241|nr:hypothetical protein [Enterococcus nangangensis]